MHKRKHMKHTSWIITACRPILIWLILIVLSGCGGSSSGNSASGGGEALELSVAIDSPTGESSISKGDTVTFQATVSGGSAPYTFVWTFGDGIPTSTVEDPGPISFSQAGTYTCTLTVTDADGVSKNSSVVVTVIEAVVDLIPTVTITSPSANISIKTGESVNFRGTAASGDTPLTYSWSFPGGTPRSSSSQNPGSVTFNAAGTYTCTLTVTDADGDTDRDSVRVTVTEVDLIPGATITTPSGNVTITEGQTVSFTGTAAGGNAPLSYAWSFPGGTPDTSSEADPGDITFATAGTYTCTFTVTDTDGDSDSASVTVTVNVDLLPIAAIDSPAGDMSINEGDTVTFLGSATGGDGSLTYAWSFPGGTPDSSTAEDPGDVTFAAAGTYTCTLTVTDEDGDADSASVVITVHAGNWLAVTAGRFHTLAIKTDGSLWAWGYNDFGQLGDGTTTSSLVPLRVGMDTDWASVHAGGVYSIALKTDGTLWAWGLNSYGQLGDGTNTTRLSPTRINDDTDWLLVSTGRVHTMAIKTDGSMWAWGWNPNGQLGDGTTTTRLAPTLVNADTDWVSVSAGEHYTLAIKADGTLWAWGLNNAGQFGDGTTTLSLIPIQVGVDDDWQTVCVSKSHSLGIKDDGTLWAWGANNYGQLGDGTNVNRLVPTLVNDDNDWLDMRGGWDHSLAVKTDGTLWAWGYNNYGQLGDGTTATRLSPVPVGTETDWCSIGTDTFDNNLALKNDGTLWAWGLNNYGQLGDGTTDNSPVPIPVNP